MNARQLVLVVIVAVVLGATGWVLFHRGVRSWESQPGARPEKVLDFPLNDVAHVRIKDGASELNLVQKADGWVVGERADYPADFEQVSRFLQTIWNLKPIETVQVGPSQYDRLELTQPAKGGKSGTLLDLKGTDDKRISALLIGKQYLKKSNQSAGPDSFPAGRYVMPEDGSRHVFLVADPLRELVTTPERWLSRDFIKIEKPKSITREGEQPEDKWKIERANDSANWMLADTKPDEELDPAKAAGLASSVSNLHFIDVLDPKAQVEITGLDKPSIVTVEAADGFIYTLRIGKLSDDKYPLTVSVEGAPSLERTAPADEKPEEKKKLDEDFAKTKKTLEEKLAREKKFEGRPFLIAKATIDQLLKKRADLIKAKPSPSPSDSGAPKLPVSPSPRPGAKPSTTTPAKP